jgi:hypothetical protein
MARTADPIDSRKNEAPYEGDYLPAPDETILRMRQSILEGEHWFEALLEAVARWRLPVERVGERTYTYLIGGEAFDWLLLAERLLGAVPDVVPQRQSHDLLFFGRWPLPMEDDEFAERIGATKHSAHLNYLYGVLVEEALQLSVEEEIHKEHANRPWGTDPRSEEGMYERVYGKPLEELLSQYYVETGILVREAIEFSQFKAFTYWLFKTRLKRQDKARVASDTRRGLAQLTRMELAVSERRRGGALDEADFAARFASA